MNNENSKLFSSQFRNYTIADNLSKYIGNFILQPIAKLFTKFQFATRGSIPLRGSSNLSTGFNCTKNKQIQTTIIKLHLAELLNSVLPLIVLSQQIKSNVHHCSKHMLSPTFFYSWTNLEIYWFSNFWREVFQFMTYFMNVSMWG